MKHNTLTVAQKKNLVQLAVDLHWATGRLDIIEDEDLDNAGIHYYQHEEARSWLKQHADVIEYQATKALDSLYQALDFLGFDWKK